MRGTDCEREESSRELRNVQVYRSNLASGVIEELGVIEEFEVTLAGIMNIFLPKMHPITAPLLTHY
jgi:hypothetical protein